MFRLYTQATRKYRTRPLFFKVCGSSHRSHPWTADLQNRSALHRYPALVAMGLGVKDSFTNRETVKKP